MTVCLTVWYWAWIQLVSFEFTNICKLDISDKGIPASNGEKNYCSSTKPNVVEGQDPPESIYGPGPIPQVCQNFLPHLGGTRVGD